MFLTFLAGRYALVLGEGVYPCIHLVMELAAVIVGICVSIIGWYAYKYKYELRMLLLSLTFCAVALVEFAHALSYAGMPDFMAPGSPNKAAAYWIAARLLFGFGMLAAVFSNKRIKRIRGSAGILALCAVFSMGLIAAVNFYLPHLPAMYDAAGEARQG